MNYHIKLRNQWLVNYFLEGYLKWDDEGEGHYEITEACKIKNPP